MGKPKKTPLSQYPAKLQQIILQYRKGRLLDPQAVKAGIMRMLDNEMKI